MSTLTRLYVGIEKPLRDWLRTQPDVLAFLGGPNVFVGIPNNGPTFPLVNLQRVGGGPDGSDTNIENPLIQVDCWGRPGNRVQANDLAALIVSVFQSQTRTTLPSGPVLLGARVTLGPLWRPDPANDAPRYQVDVQLTVTAPS